jgi:hypothetical protein
MQIVNLACHTCDHLDCKIHCKLSGNYPSLILMHSRSLTCGSHASRSRATVNQSQMLLSQQTPIQTLSFSGSLALVKRILAGCVPCTSKPCTYVNITQKM